MSGSRSATSTVREDYALFGVAPGTEFTLVKAKYRQLIKQCHPDRKRLSIINNDNDNDNLEQNSTSTTTSGATLQARQGGKENEFVEIQAAFERIRKHHFQFNVKARAFQESSTISERKFNDQSYGDAMQPNSTTIKNKSSTTGIGTETGSRQGQGQARSRGDASHISSSSSSSSSPTRAEKEIEERKGIQNVSSSSQPKWGVSRYNESDNHMASVILSNRAQVSQTTRKGSKAFLNTTPTTTTTTITSLIEEQNTLMSLLRDLDMETDKNGQPSTTRSMTTGSGRHIKKSTSKNASNSRSNMNCGNDNDDDNDDDNLVIGDNVTMSRGELRAHVKEALLHIKAKIATTIELSGDKYPDDPHDKDKDKVIDNDSVSRECSPSSVSQVPKPKLSALARMKMANVRTNHHSLEPSTATSLSSSSSSSSSAAAAAANLPETPIVMASSPPNSSPASELRFKRCTRCGNVVHRNIKYCTSCSLNLDLTQTSNFEFCKSRYE